MILDAARGVRGPDLDQPAVPHASMTDSTKGYSQI